jgi:hypothetical protein
MEDESTTRPHRRSRSPPSRSSLARRADGLPPRAAYKGTPEILTGQNDALLSIFGSALPGRRHPGCSNSFGCLHVSAFNLVRVAESGVRSGHQKGHRHHEQTR